MSPHQTANPDSERKKLIKPEIDVYTPSLGALRHDRVTFKALRALWLYSALTCLNVTTRHENWTEWMGGEGKGKNTLSLTITSTTPYPKLFG